LIYHGGTFMRQIASFAASALVAAGLSLGCHAPVRDAAEPAESSWDDQIARVRSGQSDRIQIEQTPLTDDDLQRLAGLANLRELLVDHAQSTITAAGIKRLAELPRLEHLRLRGPGLDNAAVAAIAELKSLRIVNVPRARFGDEGLASLRSLPNLQQLRFGSPHVSNAGMQVLRDLPSLRHLHLIDVPITGDGLAELARLEQLESLYIDGGAITDAGWEALFRQRPGLHVHVNQEHHDRDPHPHAH
jgi:hypothetical protein